MNIKGGKIVAKLKNLFLLITLLLFTGCAQLIQTYNIESADSIPKVTYSTYLFISGEAGRLRVAFLKNPESDIEVVPYSLQIMNTIGSFQDAMDFMRKGSGYKDIEIQGVTYKGKTIGYLLTYSTHIFLKQLIEVDFFERNGKIYFSVQEKTITS
ncbi:MAG: hypothetical protein OEZ31_02615 [Nitrospirota bacterium]|nr:hypothetical protein [Nitrospirota bacterium]MDH5767840.1 hypothetical protein [Nitrospirota bacterium]